jgi:hypothetical protein
MKHLYINFISLILSGCSFANFLDDGHGLCRSINSDYPESIYRTLYDEGILKSPNGFLTQPYSRENWDNYWNSRIYYIWDISTQSCGGTWEGLSGPEIIKLMFDKRVSMGLPEIVIEERNRDKNL